MNIAELVARHASDERRPSVVIVVRPSAESLAPALTGGPVVRSWDDGNAEDLGPRTLVEVIAPGQEDSQIADLSAALADTDVALLVFRPPPEALPIGVIADTVSRHKLTVLEACGISHRLGRTVVAVSRDAERQQRAYLTGSAIPADERSLLRQRNEWAIEGLQLRSHVHALERRIEQQAAELSQARDERRELDQELSAAVDRPSGASRRQPSTGSSRIRKAMSIVADDPVKGPLRIIKAATRKPRG